MQFSVFQIVLSKFILMIPLLSCSSEQTEWYHLEKSKNMWLSDISKCQRVADTQLTRQLNIESDTNLIINNELRIPFKMHDEREILNSHFTNCIKEKGYYKILKQN